MTFDRERPLSAAIITNEAQLAVPRRSVKARFRRDPIVLVYALGALGAPRRMFGGHALAEPQARRAQGASAVAHRLAGHLGEKVYE